MMIQTLYFGAPIALKHANTPKLGVLAIVQKSNRHLT